MSGLEGWLLSLDHDQVAALFLGLCVLAFVGGMVVSLAARVRGLEPREPLGVRHDRLDAEAARATMPTTSGRKSGRVRRG